MDLPEVVEENRVIEEPSLTAPPEPVNGTVAILPPPSFEVKKKRPYHRRSLVKAAESPSPGTPPRPVIKLHKLSPRTIARHTTVPDNAPNGNVEAEAPPAPLLPPKRKGNLNGPGLLRHTKHLKKAICPKALGRRWDGVRIKDSPTGVEATAVATPNSTGDGVVECLR